MILVDVLIAIYGAILVLGIVAVFAFAAEYIERYRKRRSLKTLTHVLSDYEQGEETPPLPQGSLRSR